MSSGRRGGRVAGAGGLLAVAVLALFALVGFGGVVRAAITFPPLSGRVVDQAGVLPAQTRADLTAKLEALQQKTSRQLVVVTLSSLQDQDIADYGYQLGRAWGIGQKGTNNGVLFIIAPTEHKTRIEVGYGLEPILTDALSSVILNRAVLPRFKAGDMPGGIVAGTDALIEQLSLDPSVAEQRAAAAADQQHQSVRSEGQGGGLFGTLWTILIVVIILSVLFRGRRGGRGGGRGGGLGGLWPLIFMGGGGGGGWGGDGGSSGGGGFSGGGGSFGGGGASGSW